MACIAGLFLAIAWLWVNWVGRSLQRQWRNVVLKFEEELFNKDEGAQKVIGPLHHSIKMGEGVYRSVSITLILMILSAGFIVLWIVLMLRVYL